MQRLKTQHEGERDSISLHMEQLDAFNTLKEPHPGTCSGLVDLIGNGLLGPSKTGPQPHFG